MSLLDYESRFSNLKMNTRGGSEKSPHKVAMLLAVLDLVESENIRDNRIYFDQVLKNKFTVHFNQLAGPSDRNNPHLPYFHLRSSGFWHDRVKVGRAGEYANLTTASGPGAIDSNIEFVELNDELFELLNYGVARELLRSALYRNLSTDDVSALLEVGNGWDWLECEAIVKDYFTMLNSELGGRPYTKSEHRRNLKPLLNNRSDGSIEYKHQNISAILLDMGQPYIQGYKPAYNYQAQLKSVVLAYLAGNHTEIDRLLDSASDQDIAEPAAIDWSTVLDSEIPEKLSTVREPERKYLALKLNYSEREEANRKLGERGEAFVIEYERHRLETLGRSDLAKEVEWSSRDRGDGLGYDVRSFTHERDSEFFIEVKTTNSGKYQPFFITDNELEFSKEKSAQYSLYRVFDFKQQARIYQLNGAVDQYVHLKPKSYKASFS